MAIEHDLQNRRGRCRCPLPQARHGLFVFGASGRLIGSAKFRVPHPSAERLSADTGNAGGRGGTWMCEQRGNRLLFPAREFCAVPYHPNAPVRNGNVERGLRL
jgi:hypothetical protein